MTQKNLKSVSLGLMIAFVLSIMPIFNIKASSNSEIARVSVNPKSTSVGINWYTDNVLTGEVWYGYTADKMIYSVSSSNLTDWHRFEIKGLTPGTTYHYQVINRDAAGKEVADWTGSFATWGIKPSSQVYNRFFYVDFDNDFYSANNQYPKNIQNPNGLKTITPAIAGSALQVEDSDSHLEYSATNVLNPSYGTVMAWVRLDNFNKDMVIWQTNDSKYALYFESGSNYKRIVARAGLDESRDENQEASWYFNSRPSSNNTWLAGEWHLIAMTWEGKLNGTVKLYIDGEMRAKANYTDGTGASSFMIGNNYRHDMNWSEGQIDEFKLYDWNMNSTDARNEFVWTNLNQQKDLISKGVVAGAQVRDFRHGSLIKAPDYKIYFISRGSKIHVADLEALKRFDNKQITTANWDEVDQYTDGGTFYSWSRFPDGTLLKGTDATVYWLWDSEKRPIASEEVFNRYNNSWSEIVTVSNAELNSYPTGFTYR